MLVTMISTSHIFIILEFFVVYSACQCSTSITDHSNILLTKNGEVLLPTDNSGNIDLAKDDKITMACPGRRTNHVNVQPGVQSVTATCVSKDLYKVNRVSYHAKDITCAQTPSPTEEVMGTCLGTNKLVSIGFKDGTNFIPHIELCFNDNTKETYYTHAVLSKRLCCCQIGDRVNFRTGKFFTGVLANKYNMTQQVATLTDILGGGRVLPSYINLDNLFQIGHLVAKCDFVYEIQQKLTFFYKNAAPQWESFNNGNWRVLEGKLRNFISRTGSDFDVYTGTFGVLKLENSMKRKSEIYLNWNPRARTFQIPAPEYFWKVVIRRSDSRGLAIIGSNNIFEAPSRNLCIDIINQATWLTHPQWKTVRSGYTIACSVNNFLSISGISNQLPTFLHVSGNLLR